MKVRAKFVVNANDIVGEDQHQINMNAVSSGSPENEEFFKYTPAGQITLGIVNGQVAEQFKHGQEYYVDFTLAEKSDTVSTADDTATKSE